MLYCVVLCIMVVQCIVCSSCVLCGMLLYGCVLCCIVWCNVALRDVVLVAIGVVHDMDVYVHVCI